MEGLWSVFGEFELASYGLGKEKMVASLCYGYTTALFAAPFLGVLSDLMWASSFNRCCYYSTYKPNYVSEIWSHHPYICDFNWFAILNMNHLAYTWSTTKQCTVCDIQLWKEVSDDLLHVETNLLLAICIAVTRKYAWSFAPYTSLLAYGRRFQSNQAFSQLAYVSLWPIQYFHLVSRLGWSLNMRR